MRAKGQATNKFSWVSTRIRIGGETTTKLLMHNELEARADGKRQTRKYGQWKVEKYMYGT